VSEHAVLDLFAGTGVGVACQQLGVTEYGVEKMAAAQETRNLNGMGLAYDDVWDIEKAAALSFDTLWASPPCQTFSVAGKGEGRKALTDVLEAIRAWRWTSVESLRTLGEEVGDERTALVLTPLAYVYRYRPTYIVFEQVPAVLPVWEACAGFMRDMGYAVWTGYLHAEQYDVPQTRKRAYLIARSDGKEAKPPMPAGSKVSMFDALGWGISNRPSPTVTGHMTATRSPSGTQAIYLKAISSGNFIFRPGASRKNSTVAKNGIGSMYPPDSVNITISDGCKLQGYPDGFVISGTKADQQLQVGNAVPPPVARAVLGELWT